MMYAIKTISSDTSGNTLNVVIDWYDVRVIRWHSLDVNNIKIVTNEPLTEIVAEECGDEAAGD